MKIDQVGLDFLESQILFLGISNSSVSKYEEVVNDCLRVKINNNEFTQNQFNACVSHCIELGEETFRKCMLVKYINKTLNLNGVTIQNGLTLADAQSFVRLGIAYCFLTHAKDTEDIVRRKAENKLYWS